MQGPQQEKDARTLPSRERCRQVLEEPNRDVDRWTCPVCRETGSRAHWIADHIIHHLDFPDDRGRQ